MKHRNMWKHIPTTRRLEMIEKIKRVRNTLDKEVLTLCFINDMSCIEAAEYVKNNNMCIGKKGNPLSVRRIQQICKEYFPDCYNYPAPVSAAKQRQKELRKECLSNRTNILTKSPLCELCGSSEHLEIHHDIPLSRGGDNDAQNLYVLCHKCHMRIESNRKRIYGADYYNNFGR